jgi:hypothetical protein
MSTTVKRIISMLKRWVARWPSADRPPVRQIRTVAVPLMTDVPENARRIFHAGSGIAGTLLGGIGLARQQSLVDVMVSAFAQSRVGGDEIAGNQLDDIAWHQSADRDRDGSAVASHGRLHGHRSAKRFHSLLSSNILDKVKDDADHHNDHDHDEAADR